MSITVSLPAWAHEQVLLNEQRFIDGGVHVSIDEDRNSTLTFPDTAELTYFTDAQEGHRIASIASIASRDTETGLSMGTWSFDERYITQRTGGHR